MLFVVSSLLACCLVIVACFSLLFVAICFECDVRCLLRCVRRLVFVDWCLVIVDLCLVCVVLNLVLLFTAFFIVVLVLLGVC